MIPAGEIEALRYNIIQYLYFLSCASAGHLDSVTLVELFDKAVGNVAQFQRPSIT